MTRVWLWACCVTMLAAAVSGAPIYTFSFSSSTQTFNIDSVSAFSQTGLSSWTIEKPIDSLTPKLTQSVALGTPYASAHEVEYDGAIAPELVVASYDFTGVVFTSHHAPRSAVSQSRDCHVFPGQCGVYRRPCRSARAQCRPPRDGGSGGVIGLEGSAELGFASVNFASTPSQPLHPHIKTA